MDRDWVHDLYEDDRFPRRSDPARRAPRERSADGYIARRNDPQPGKIRVEGLHYELTEANLRELFMRIGPIQSADIVYDRSDRSTGVAFVVYNDERDAKEAIRWYDGANAKGQPISLSMIPVGPSQRARATAAGTGASLFDRIEPRDDEASDRRAPLRRAPEGVDRYVPGDRYIPGDRSPPRRERGARRGGGAPRDNGRRRGGGGGGGNGGGRRGGENREEGRATAGGRPRKTVDELDAEMADYFGTTQGGSGATVAADETGHAANDTADAGLDADIDMVE